MSKALLVMDMPESCDVCPFSTIYETPDGLVECENPLSEEYGCNVSDYEGARPKGCPLRGLPKKKHALCNPTVESCYYEQGWNGCLDKITGEREG